MSEIQKFKLGAAILLVVVVGWGCFLFAIQAALWEQIMTWFFCLPMVGFSFYYLRNL